MIFTSYTYVCFLAAAFVIHWLLPVRWRKPFLIGASYLFYASWRWEFSFLLLGVSLFNWAYARRVLARAGEPGPLWPGVLVNLAPLVYFKYTGFIFSNVAWAGGLFGAGWTFSFTQGIILPLGISFFTFQGIAYLVDVSTGDEPFELTDFLLYKAFWPQLIAGPIVRPGEVRPYLEGPRTLDYPDFAEGCRRVLIGLGKKILLADKLAPVADAVFLARTPNGVDAIIGVIAFGLQIYFDFSAYSDIAIGSARLFGFRFPENFDWPYQSRSPQEFWSRWHMSLSRWIRDYVFTPLAFATRSRPATTNLWLLVAMAAVGLWHGAQWTFVVWGVWHGVLLVLNQTLLKRFFPGAAGTREAQAGVVRGFLAWLVTVSLVMVGWVFFRAATLAQAADLIGAALTLRGGLAPSVLRVNGILITGLFFLGLLLAQLGRPLGGRLARARGGMPGWTLRALRPLAYALLVLAVIVMHQEANKFVYFQF